MKEALLDTDTISFFLKGNSKVVKKMDSHFNYFGYWNMSVITYYEIMNGLIYKDAKQQIKAFEIFKSQSQIFPLNIEIADLGAEIYSNLRRSSQMIGHNDVLIGASAIHHNFVMVTNNLNHFNRIPGLELENWMG